MAIDCGCYFCCPKTIKDKEEDEENARTCVNNESDDGPGKILSFGVVVALLQPLWLAEFQPALSVEVHNLTLSDFPHTCHSFQP